MEVHDFHIWGERISLDNLAILLARGTGIAIQKHPFVNFVEARKCGEQEGIIADFNVELPQEPPVPIQTVERILIRFDPDESKPPVCSPLRQDFPETQHVNLTPQGAPKELCIFGEEFTELRTRLSPRSLLDRIADWLDRAAVEDLHLPDQPLEPFLLGADRIIFDTGILSADQGNETLYVVQLLSEKPGILRAVPLPGDLDPSRLPPDRPLHLLLPLEASPWHSRLINHQPESFADLTTLLQQVDIDIEDEASKLIVRTYKNGTFARLADHRLILVLKLPKTRSQKGGVESTEWWSFIVISTLKDLAIKLDAMTEQDGYWIPVPGERKAQDLDQLKVCALRPTYSLSKEFARLLSGIREEDPRFAVIGAGTLGSQVILDLARQGIGDWVIVDDDHLLPHNLPRHALSYEDVGRNKADALADEIRGLLNEHRIVKSFNANALRLPADNEELKVAFQNPDLLLDFSASHAVSRHLAVADYPASRMCSFLGPNAKFSILLYEGQERTVRIDDLEIQLMVGIAEREHLHRIFIDKTADVPYAGSCRDASVQLPQEIVSIHAGAISNFLKKSAFSVSPSIILWEWSEDNFSLTRHLIPVHGVTVVELNGWTLRVSHHATELMRFYRRRRLPNETGGILLGDVDQHRRIVYVGTVLPSPPDSAEWPRAYIRGVRGLKEELESIERITRGDLVYVGEWHSHPVDAGSSPSHDDNNAHEWLVREMGKVGLPGLVLIQGDDRQPHVLIDEEE